jgi:hypothetical protein
MLSDLEQIGIDLHTVGGPENRYPEFPRYLFRGTQAFDLHNKLVSLGENFKQSFIEEEKVTCFLIVSIQTTVSKAALKNPNAAPLIPNTRVKTFFYSKGHQPVTSRIEPSKKKWALRILDAEPNNLIGYL